MALRVQPTQQLALGACSPELLFCGSLHEVVFDTAYPGVALGSSCLWVHGDTQHIDSTLKEPLEVMVTRIPDLDLLIVLPSLDKPLCLSYS